MQHDRSHLWKLVTALTGMTPRSMVQAPPEVIGVVASLNTAMKRAAYLVGGSLPENLRAAGGFKSSARWGSECGELVEKLGPGKPFRLDEVEQLPSVRAFMMEAMGRTGIGSFFR